jgi:hypothetical protein
MEDRVAGARAPHRRHHRDVAVGPLTHPGWAPYLRWLARDAAPALATLDAWAREAGLPLRFVPSVAPLSALAYERRIAERGEIPTREGIAHDLCNALAWLAFPRTKAALNAVHVREAATATPNERSRLRDAATLLDESGLVVACADRSLVEGWRRHAWRETFWLRRDDVGRDLAACVLGHGLLERLPRAHRGLTAKALVLDLPAATPQADLDAAAADAIASGILPESLLPLPIAALPGWDREQLGAALFADASVFRPCPDCA